MNLIRHCPQCDNDIKYASYSSKNRSERSKALCKNCRYPDLNKKKVKSKTERNIKHKDTCSNCSSECFFKTKTSYNDFLNRNKICTKCNKKLKGRGIFKRKCPNCSEEINYKYQYRRNFAEERKMLCRKCTGKNNMTNEVRQKISKATSGENNAMYGKPSPIGSGNGWKGWYKEVYFASLLELFYLKYLIDNNIEFENGEQRKYTIQYEFVGGTKNYFLDFYLPETNEYIEVKPKKLVHSPKNTAKFNSAKEKLGDNFKVLTEEDLIQIDLEEMYNLFTQKDLIFMERYIEKFLNYYEKHK